MKRIYLLSSEKYSDAIHFPTIKIEFLKKDVDFSKIDTLIFTSKNGVKAIDNISNSWKNIPALSVGEKTSNKIREFGGNLIFTSKKFYGNILAQDILDNFTNRKFLYIRPEIVASNLTERLIDSGVQIIESILYKTVCADFGVIEVNSIIIATSPSTVNCLLKKEIPENSIFVAIGTTTFKAIPNKYEKYISEHQTINSCIKYAKEILI